MVGIWLKQSIAVFIGVLLGYNSRLFPILPREIASGNYWGFIIENYWWLMLLFFLIGYGLTILVFYLIEKLIK